jgi:adenylate cyclase
MAIQQGLSDYNSTGPTTPIHVRIGLGAGEPVTEGEALFGSTVNLTARICAYAKPDQILAAHVIRDLCMGKKFSFADSGNVALKGIQEPVRLFEVQWEKT